MKFVTQNLSLIGALGALASSAPAGIILVDWVGPNGDIWHDTANWNPQVIPNNGSGNEYHAIISTRFGSLVNLDGNATVSSLTIGAKDHLHINNGRILWVSATDPKAGAGIINNAGLIEIGSTGAATYLRPTDGPVSLIGGGTVVLSDNASNFLYNGGDGSLINVDNTIRGAGNLSWTSSGTWMDITNQSLIVADATNPLRILPTGALFTNEGVLRAEKGGTLQLNGGSYGNVGGIIEALAASEVTLNGAAIITGGELTTAGDGVLRVSSSTPRLVDLTNSGHMFIDNGRTLQVQGAIENAGTIEIGSTGSATHLRPADGPVSLIGGGTVVLSDNLNNYIYNGGGDGSLVNVDNMIRGAGNLSWTSSSTWLDITNQSLIVADATNPLRIWPTGAPFTNEGVLRAENGATLQLNAGEYDNTGGVIEALAGSTVALDGNATITGGELTSESDGVVRVTNNTPRLVDVSNTGQLSIDNGRILQLQGTIENTGSIEVGSTGSATYLRPTDGVTTLTGGGTIVLSDNLNNFLYNGGGGSLVNVDNTIRGAGNLSWTSSGAWLEVTNQSLIVADTNNALRVWPTGAPFTNEGVLRAKNGATLQLNAGDYDNTNGVIEALAGSTVTLDGNATITGGELTSEADGVVRVTNNTPRLVDASNTGQLSIDNGRILQLQGTIENTGTIEIGSTGSSTYLRPTDGITTLTGGGTVVLSDNLNNYIYNGGGDGSLINVDNTIRGAGNLSWTSSGTWLDITNQGTIVADADNNPLRIFGHSPNGFVNDVNGLIEVTGTGGLTSSGGTFTNLGQITIHPERTMSRAVHLLQAGGAMTVNGELAITGGGNQLQLQGGLLNGNGQINGVVNNTGGNVNPGASAGLLTVIGTYLQSDSGVLTVEIDGDTPVTEHDVINVLGEAQLGGMLQPTFNEALAPDVGDQWTVLTADFRAGTFNAVAPCEAIRVIYSDDSVVVEYTGVVKFADLNCDGVVDVLDMLIVIGAWGACGDADPCPADLNGDNVVNVIDLLDLLGDWG